MFRALASPKFIIPLFLGLALVGALVGASDTGKIASVMQRLDPARAAQFVLLMVLYEAIRGVQWHVLLTGLGLRVPFNAQAFSFLYGEASKTAPIGNYFQNYLLTRIEGEDFGRTAAATTLIVLTEVAWGLFALVVIGIDSWTWLRPLILIGLGIFFIVLIVVFSLERHMDAPAWVSSNRLTRGLLDELTRFRHGVELLIRPRHLATQAVLCAAYLTTAGAAMYVLVLGLSITQFSLWQMLGIYAFSLTAGLIVPLPVDLGVVELSGAGALVASGVPRETAVSIVLLNRLLTVGSAMGIAAIGTIFLRDELREAFTRRDRAPGHRLPARSGQE